ncbi:MULTISPECIES: BglG family transcription antiterminator [unclassified Streptococcus]|uniref:BglG family transcription antiterminator n=1 Tax=unclassified Streptococcus TaxID=2608887 RepID=UPI0010716BED|nr:MULTISPECIES: PTS sugar transporter subunit IIA [unclassified Streptococcus]MBF0805702.1 transcription antiterminator [Streptococcus sp. 19428wA2_WM07]TFU28745.1 transcription antiterminator [Streptococcus sp. WM07]
MILSKREEDLLKAFLQIGKLSLKEMTEILQVSSRTVYRTLSDLSPYLDSKGIEFLKEGRKYYLEGDLAQLTESHAQEVHSPSRRQLLMTYDLLLASQVVTNEQLQETYSVSNVTVIQDIAAIEVRLRDFQIQLSRTQGYTLLGTASQKRRLLAILLANAISVQDFWMDHYAEYAILAPSRVAVCRQLFEEFVPLLGEVDAKLKQFFILLLSLANGQEQLEQSLELSKEALEFSQKLFRKLSLATKQFYNVQEIVYFATMIDEVIIRRQETPLFRESFDSRFYYSVSQLIDSVSRFSKSDFMKDQLLFSFLFNHIRLSLAVPVLFPDAKTANMAFLTSQGNPFLHRLVSLLVQEFFPAYMHNEYEYELVTLHFAASLRRSPEIFPIRLLLVTDERPLSASVLVSKIKTIAPFVEGIDVKSSSKLEQLHLESYDYCLTTKPLSKQEFQLISTFPSTQEMLELQETLQRVQENRTIRERGTLEEKIYDLPAYLEASRHLLESFRLVELPSQPSFEAAVATVVGQLESVFDSNYVTEKLLNRFYQSPLAIPHTNLALLHTQTSQVGTSQFLIAQLPNSVSTLSMNQEREPVSRLLMMVTPVGELEEVRDLMTAISQSIIENKLYTEIYRTGNQEILYQLLNTIFAEKMKKIGE